MRLLGRHVGILAGLFFHVIVAFLTLFSGVFFYLIQLLYRFTLFAFAELHRLIVNFD